MSDSPATYSTSWLISEDSLRWYVLHASENCIQELLWASDSNKVGSITVDDVWKVVAIENDVEISKLPSGSLHHTFCSRWVLKWFSSQKFMTVANAIDAAKIWGERIQGFIQVVAVASLPKEIAAGLHPKGKQNNCISLVGLLRSFRIILAW